ncbi:hypothetical protein LY78DRAFT_267113 [Colletotrichum sublineola]|nr:hypothetical protein LY78DRAFT_267113 [Colletotrichum sublineola]
MWRQMDDLFGSVRRPNCMAASRVVDEKIFVVPVWNRVRLYGVEIAAEIGPSRCVDSFAFVFFFFFVFSYFSSRCKSRKWRCANRVTDGSSLF